MKTCQDIVFFVSRKIPLSLYISYHCWNNTQYNIKNKNRQRGCRVVKALASNLNRKRETLWIFWCGLPEGYGGWNPKTEIYSHPIQFLLWCIFCAEKIAKLSKARLLRIRHFTKPYCGFRFITFRICGKSTFLIWFW